MSTYADHLYWEGIGPEDLEDVVDDVRIDVYIVAETAHGYFVNNVRSRRGSHFLDHRCMSTIKGLLGGQSIITVQRSWVDARKLQNWIEREVDIDDYPCVDEFGNEIEVVPKLPTPPRELGPDEEPF